MDTTAYQLLTTAHELHARSGGSTHSADRPASYKVVGLALAIASGFCIGASFVIKKHGLLQANAKYNEEAGEGYSYLKNAWWWLGMSLMIVGEICNLVAYAFTDAILVTPMGALSVVVCAILSSVFLKERLSFVGKVGCFNCIIGSVVIAISAPEQSAVARIQDMKHLVIAPGFLSYAGVVVIVSAVIALWLGPKYGKKTMMVYITICSLIGGLSVVATQGLGAAVVAQASGRYGGQFKEWFLYVLLAFVVITLLTEIIYLNKALNLFNAALVTPTYYVLFTSSTIVTSAVLFQGFKGTPIQIISVIMGFLQICSGVVLLQLSKSAKDVPDTAVFKGDLDQMRTVAEMEEPEYEPRADTLRGGAAILRTLSTARSKKELSEALKIKEEHMASIGEGDVVEFDGIRRRRTVVGDSNRPSARQPAIVRTKMMHPPLGMSHFPVYDSEEEDNESYHPGFFQRLRSRGKSTNSQTSTNAPGSNVVNMRNLPSIPADDGAHEYDSLSNNVVNQRQQDPHVQFALLPDFLSPSAQEGPSKSPMHIAKRQFSFNNVFGRNRAASTGEATGSKRPTSRHSQKESSQNKLTATEEERLGLVKGDSSTQPPIESHSAEDMLPQYTDTPSQSPERRPSRVAEGIGRVKTNKIDTRDDETDFKRSGSRGAFL